MCFVLYYGKMKEKNTMKALIYARQSSGKDDLSESVEAQIDNCKKLAAKESLEIIGVFRDLNTSGETYPIGAESVAQLDNAYQQWIMTQSSKKNFRSGLGEAISLFPEIDVLLVNEVTRLYRPIHGSFLESYINQLIKDNHVKVLQVQGGSIDLMKFDQQLITMIKNQILYEDLQKKRSNAIIAFRNKRDSGKICNGCHCFGLQYLGNDKIKVIPECAEIIRFVYDSICAHKSYRHIIRECNARWGKAQKIFFYESSIYHIAKQPLYAGYQYNSNHELIKNVQITGQEIVTFDQWKQVQDIINDKRKNYRTQEKKRSLPLSGRLFCGVCGSRLVINLDHQMVYYHCNRRTLSRDHRKCLESRIRFQEGKRAGNFTLHDAVYPLLTVALLDKLDKMKEILKAKEEISDYEAELQNMQNEIDATYDLIKEGLATMIEMRNILLKQKERKEILIRNIAEIKASCVNETDIEELENTIMNDLLEQIIDKSLPPEKYAELVGLIDLHGTIYGDRAVFHTIYGEITLPRLKKKNFKCMPDWTMQIEYGKRKRFDENTKITVIYKTGQKRVLANWDKMKVISK